MSEFLQPEPIEVLNSQELVPLSENKKREAVLSLCGGEKPDVVFILGAGLTKRTQAKKVLDIIEHPDGTMQKVTEPGSLRERTSAYTGRFTHDKALASGARARVLAASTISTLLDTDSSMEFVTTGGSTISYEDDNPYSGTSSSAVVMDQELRRYTNDQVKPEKITQDTMPTSTSAEVFDIMFYLKKCIDTGKEFKNCVTIASLYQKTRLSKMIEIVMDEKGREWFLASHAKALDGSEARYKEAFALLQTELEKAVASIKEKNIHIEPVSAEAVLEYRSDQWKDIVTQDLPNWDPWKNRMLLDDQKGVEDIVNQTYVFNTEKLEEYLDNRSSQ